MNNSIIQKYEIIKFSFEDILSVLNKNGFCILRNYYDANTVDILEKEFDEILIDRNLGNTHKNDGIVISKSLYPQSFNFEKFAKINGVFNDTNFKNILKKKYHNGILTPEKIFLAKTIGTHKKNFKEIKNKSNDSVFQLHTDRKHFLKFFIYLTDVTKECGPLNVIPASHKKYKMKRHAMLAKFKKKNYKIGFQSILKEIRCHLKASEEMSLYLIQIWPIKLA